MTGLQLGALLTVATIIASVVGALVQVISVKATTKKLGAESVNLDVSSAKAVADMAVELLQPYKVRLTEQQEEHKQKVKELQDELITAKRQADSLTIQLGRALAELELARSQLQKERENRDGATFTDPLTG